MKNFGNEQSFNFGAGEIIIPSIKTIEKNGDTVLASIVYYAAYFLFIHEYSFEESSFSLFKDRNRLFVFMDEERKNDSWVMTFFRPDSIPFLMALPAIQVSELNQKNITDCSAYFALLTLLHFEDWFEKDYTTRTVLKQIIKTSSVGNYKLETNFGMYHNQLFRKYYGGYLDYDAHLEGYEIKDRLHKLFEKEMFEQS